MDGQTYGWKDETEGMLGQIEESSGAMEEDQTDRDLQERDRN